MRTVDAQMENQGVTTMQMLHPPNHRTHWEQMPHLSIAGGIAKVHSASGSLRMDFKPFY